MSVRFTGLTVERLLDRVRQQTTQAVRLQIFNGDRRSPMVVTTVNGVERIGRGSRAYREAAAVLLALLAESRTGAEGGHEPDEFEVAARDALGEHDYLIRAFAWAIREAHQRQAYVNHQHLLAILEDVRRAAAPAGGARPCSTWPAAWPEAPTARATSRISSPSIRGASTRRRRSARRAPSDRLSSARRPVRRLLTLKCSSSRWSRVWRSGPAAPTAHLHRDKAGQ